MKDVEKKKMTKLLICQKKAVALGALVVLVGVAGYLNFVYDKSDGTQSTLNEYVETVKDIENEQQNAGEARERGRKKRRLFHVGENEPRNRAEREH